MSDDTSAPIPGGPARPREQRPEEPLPESPEEPPPEPPEEPPREQTEEPPPAIAPLPGPPSMPSPQPEWQEGFLPQPPPPYPPSEQEAWLSTQSVVPPPTSPKPVPPSHRVARRRRPLLWAPVAGGFALVGLAIGLVVWAPWSPQPQAPTAVRVSSPTATTALVSWAAPTAGAKPTQYDILRDGKEQGTVPGTQTSWTDTGLAPGSKHSYTVITEGNGQKSAPSAAATVQTITPPPADVTVSDQTYTTVTLHWSPPPKAPIPDQYTIYDTSAGKDLLETVAGSRTSYTVTHLIPGDDYTFSVTASWGPAESGASPLDAPPLSPPLSGTVPVNLKVTQILPKSQGLTLGETWADNWNFTANCPATTCTLTDKGSLISTIGPFTAKLTPANGGYQGQATHVAFSHCNGASSYETVILRIYPSSGGVANGAWTSWHGTMTLAYPGQLVGSAYCAPGDWDVTLTSAG